ncbi:Phycobilisome degradation protein nblA [Xenococcus sp. PCC 7305]|uniref:NblA/ycf18 family protein n=1 Tax=Xenococcus sp. PCC 7305 TaxID=102125 RepID=UPI0002ACF556|nr:NblA/ycf18 family protein [Xenococcus sp. PCC 7305]ELS02318.1 Phycobilisome degradation protein nblA [Xenococcus sp. PCC 7305]
MNNNDKNIGQLSLEQQFQLEVLRKDIENMSLEQAKEYLFEAFRQMMVKDNLCRDLFKSCYL